MATQLHARRKPKTDHDDYHTDEEQPLSQSARRGPHDVDGEKSHHPPGLFAVARDMKKKQLKQGRTEAWGAATTVGSFLFIGICLGHVLLHAQHRRVALHVMKNPWAHGQAVFLRGRVGFRHHFYSGPPRYVTVIMPSVVKPEGRVKRLKSIQDTWGAFARSIFVLHNLTEFPQVGDHHLISEDSFPHDPYSYPQALMIPDAISVDDGIPRLMHVIHSIHKKVDPDFAFFVNDHTYVIPEHLCNYLEEMDPSKDLYAGHALKDKDDVFNSGAAGYLLSRSTMGRLVKAWDEKIDPHCNIVEEGAANTWLQGNPGLLTTRCLEKSMNITAIDTREGGKFHRFHAFPITRVVSGQMDQWYIDKHTIEVAQKIGASDSYAKLLSGEDCCAPTSVSFHYVEHKEAKALFATREKLLEQPTIPDHELKEFMTLEWPRSPKDVGFYSRPLPESHKLTGDDGWEALLKVMRKISTRETQRDC